jgi:hypothetical protein
MDMTIKADSLQKVLDYLVKRPYDEVHLLVKLILEAQAIEKNEV